MNDEKRTDTGDETQKTTESLPPPEVLPARIGPYRILNKTGEGGMGVVYEA